VAAALVIGGTAALVGKALLDQARQLPEPAPAVKTAGATPERPTTVSPSAPHVANAKVVIMPGRAVRAVVHTADITGRGHDRNYADLNSSIQNLRASIDEEAGRVCFAFDYDDDSGSLVWNAVHGGLPILVRLFDQHSNYLTHFVTQEAFASKNRLAQMPPEALTFMNAKALEDRGNQFCYSVNARDASFVKAIEVGFLLKERRHG
jgi:hypothetical protein